MNIKAVACVSAFVIFVTGAVCGYQFGIRKKVVNKQEDKWSRLRPFRKPSKFKPYIVK